jgi:hypothetical protein
MKLRALVCDPESIERSLRHEGCGPNRASPPPPAPLHTTARPSAFTRIANQDFGFDT